MFQDTMSEKKSKSIFRSMVDPRGFMRRVLELQKRSTWYIAFFVGVVWLFDRALQYQLGFYCSSKWIVLFSVIFGVAAGYLYLYLTSWILYWTGKIFKGKADFNKVYLAFVWSRMPVFFVMISWFSLVALLHEGAFTNVLIYTGLPFIVPSLIWIQILFGFWSFILLFHTVGEVQEFSAWVAIWNVLLTYLILGIIYQFCMYFIAELMVIHPMAVKEFMFMGKFLT